MNHQELTAVAAAVGSTLLVEGQRPPPSQVGVDTPFTFQEPTAVARYGRFHLYLTVPAPRVARHQPPTHTPPQAPPAHPARRGQSAAFFVPENAANAAMAKKTKVSGSESAFQASWTTSKWSKKTLLKFTPSSSAPIIASPTNWPR